MNDIDRQNLAEAYTQAWNALKGTTVSVTVDRLGWFTIKHTMGATLTSQRVRASELLNGLVILTARLATRAKNAA